VSSRGDLRWNFAAGVIDAAGWGTAMGLISATTVLPLFVQQLTESPFAVGMIQASMLFGWLLPGIATAGWVDRQPQVKASVMWVAALERLALFVVAPACLLLGPWNRSALLSVFFACWFIMNAAVGANTPGYYKLIATTIPAELRGRLYGFGGAISGLLGAAAALGSGKLLQGGFPNGFAACFAAAWFLMTVSVIPIGFMRERPQPLEHLPPPEPPWRAVRLILEDRRLLWLCVAAGLFSLNGMAGAFYTLYALQRFHASAETVAQFTAVLMAVRTVAYLLVGWLGDRYGNRLVLQLSTGAGLAAAALALLAPDLGWMYPVFAWSEVAGLGWGVCSMNYVLELAPPARSGTYTAVYSLFSGPLRILAPLLGGLLVQLSGFLPLFATALLGTLISLVLLLLWVPEPRNERQPAQGTGCRTEPTSTHPL